MHPPRTVVLLCLMVLLVAGCYQAPLAALPVLPAARALQAPTPTVVPQATAPLGAAAPSAATVTAVATPSSAAAPAAAATPAAANATKDTHLTQCAIQQGGASVPVTGGISLKDALPSLQPQIVWTSFYSITQVPRPSGHTEQIAAFLVKFGNGLNLQTTQDKAGNVLIRKPASKGMENRPGVVLQAHMDMVGQPATFDFVKNPIQAYVVDDWVHTYNNSTTLGADDGIGIAIIMALLQMDVKAPAMEALFTVDEETTQSGINGLAPDELDGEDYRDYINVDSEAEGQFTIGSAGGQTMTSTLALQAGTLPVTAGTFYTVTVTGLKGGHSGLDIDKGRGNATKLLVRALAPAGEQYGVRLAALQGGTAKNAIPSEADALVQVPSGQVGGFANYLKTFETTVRKELTYTEPSLAVKFITATLTMTPTLMAPASQEKALDVLYANPQGVLRMSDVVTGLVETSNNLGIVRTANGFVEATNLSRGSVDSELTDAGNMLMSTWDLAGAQSAVTDRSPGWDPNPQSPLLGLFGQQYYDLNHVDACYTALHAGLECASVASAYPGMDMISIGPTLIDVHSPTERVQISTVSKVLDLLVNVLGQIPAP